MYTITDATRSLSYNARTGDYTATLRPGGVVLGSTAASADAARFEVRRAFRYQQAHDAAVARVLRWVGRHYAGRINARSPVARLWRQALTRAFARAHKRASDGSSRHHYSRWAAAAIEIIVESRDKWKF